MLVAVLSMLAAWSIATAVLIGIFAATSVDEFRDIVKSAMLDAVPAIWVIPAALILKGGTIPELLIGLVLLGNAVRQLVSVRPPRKLAVNIPTSRESHGTIQPFYSQTLPLIGGALLLQTGIALGVAHRHVLGSTLFVCGISILSWWWSSARVSQRRPPLRTVPLTIMAALALTVLQYQAQSTPPIAVADPKPPSFVTLSADGVDPKDIKPLPAKDLVPGVILRPKTKPSKIQPVPVKIATQQGIGESTPTVLKFSGEYHLFPASSRRVQPDSTVIQGTPLDAAYVSLSGGAIETEALQPFQPPIDLTNCGQILVKLTNGERSPASATMRLVTTTGDLELGTEIFGLEPTAEVLAFPVPSIPTNLLVKAIRVIFYRDPFNRARSAKIAIDEFTLVPR